VVKIAASKIDFSDGSAEGLSGYAQGQETDLQRLAARAQAEIEEIKRQDALKEEEKARKGAAPKKEKKKKLRVEQRKGNFSMYRNKSFIPGASKGMSDSTVSNSSRRKRSNSLPHEGKGSGDESGSEAS
jgi:hypothetical protein